MVEINSTTKSLPLHIEVYPTSVYAVEAACLILVLEIPNLSFYG